VLLAVLASVLGRVFRNRAVISAALEGSLQEPENASEGAYKASFFWLGKNRLIDYCRRAILMMISYVLRYGFEHIQFELCCAMTI